MKQIPNIEEEIRHFCNAFAMTMPPSNEMMQATRNLRKLLPSFIHHQLQKARPEGYEQGYTQGKFDEKMDAEYKHPEELQKAREEEKERLFKNPLELFRGNRIKMTLEAREALLMAIDIIPDHSELDQLTRDDWNEDMERSHTLAELDQDKGNVSQSDLYGHSTTANATGVNNCTGAELDQDKK